MSNVAGSGRGTVAKVAVLGTIGAILSLVIIGSTYEVVPSGHVGVVTHFGAVQNDILPEGLHFTMPFRTSIIPITVRVQKLELDATGSSKDLQGVSSRVALNFYLDKTKANLVFQELGADYEYNIIQPTIQESIKATTAGFTAEELITRRTDVKQVVFDMITKRLSQNHIIVTDFSIIDFKFSEEFNHAIEAKQIAEQRALTAKNDLSRIQTEAQQAKARAEGEAQAQLAIAKAQAEANALLSQAITDKILQLKAIEKWDGVMPVSTGGNTTSLIDISTITGKKK
jgi:regulator of protease activity HflC (stomatin/prohibitin superfamily)